MDRDKRWSVQKVYNALVLNEGNLSNNATQTIEALYNEGVTDEFIEPIVVTDEMDKLNQDFRRRCSVVF